MNKDKLFLINSRQPAYVYRPQSILCDIRHCVGVICRNESGLNEWAIPHIVASANRIVYYIAHALESLILSSESVEKWPEYIIIDAIIHNGKVHLEVPNIDEKTVQSFPCLRWLRDWNNYSAYEYFETIDEGIQTAI